ncbi:hypothetical protein FA10DRAFT_265691 [Acaromyces ingoldii]|uniref:Uncharacterized protein n=1 Tax=Acaromyces ingoldii TaxID=215250 RepID=A0A316YT56_9BASI|nr:hypothetical protein FA10DRAFT_265691 [Acaromyces ingoldii]PWN91858.1 hypothetical protein FA10DRAFT_265691 [Acaromyces ingoldii]
MTEREQSDSDGEPSGIVAPGALLLSHFSLMSLGRAAIPLTNTTELYGLLWPLCISRTP